jgi:hypothetical protein
MTEKHAYEAYGIRAEDGASFTVEILGERTLDEAARLAGHYAETWRAAVDLYRVPGIRTGSAPWAADQMQFVCRVRPSGAV